MMGHQHEAEKRMEVAHFTLEKSKPNVHISIHISFSFASKNSVP